MTTLVNEGGPRRKAKLARVERDMRAPGRMARAKHRDPSEDSGAWALPAGDGITCVGCGLQIPRKRLLAAPHAIRCFECQLAHETRRLG
jgi:hypothetical protein